MNIPWFKYNLNRMLIEANRTLRVLDARFVHDAFEPKLAAIQRTYLYRFNVSQSIEYSPRNSHSLLLDKCINDQSWNNH